MFYFNEPISKRMKRLKVGNQSTLARLCNLSTGSISKVMNKSGCDSVNMKTLTRIAVILGCNVWQLVKEAETFKGGIPEFEGKTAEELTSKLTIGVK